MENGTNATEEGHTENFGWRKYERIFAFWKKNLPVDEVIILKVTVKNYGGENVDWIILAADRNNLEAVVNTVMNFMVP